MTTSPVRSALTFSLSYLIPTYWILDHWEWIVGGSIASFIILILLFIFLNRSREETSIADTSDLVEVRFEELRAMVRAYQRTQKWSGRAAGLLTFTQYVIGGVITTLYFQGHLPGPLLGTLGLAVLVGTAIQQNFRPDVKFRKAERGQARAQKLRRIAEDMRAEKREMRQVLAYLTGGINEIQHDESLDPDSRLTPPPPSIPVPQAQLMPATERQPIPPPEKEAIRIDRNIS